MAITRRAFTLTELLVVLAIIAVISGILFPVFASAKSSAHKAVCLSNFRQVGLASTLYTQEYDDVFVIVNHQPASEPNSRNDRTWVQLLLPYVRSFKVFRCPDDHSGGPTPEATFDQDLVPGDIYSSYFTASLRTNAGYNFQYLSPIVRLGGAWAPRPRNMGGIVDPTRMLAFIDSVWTTVNGNPTGGGSWLVSPPCRYETVNGRWVDTFTYAVANPSDSAYGQPTLEVYEPVQGWDAGSQSSTNPYGGVYPWHGKYANVSRIDGGAKSMTVEQITDGCALLPEWRGPIVNASVYAWNPH